MSVLSGLSRADFKTASDGLLELSEERLRSIMRSEPITDVYHVEQTPFARGKFASVRKIRHLVSGEEYAAKFIRKRRRAADTTREIHHEVAVLALCAGCKRVVSLHEVYETRSEVAIVLELCTGGELQHVLDEEERLTEGETRRALHHVLEGLAHLHARRVAHLDLKPQNLLLSAGGEELLICDFGISRAIQPGAHVREILGTRDYVAPEILSYEPLSLAADIWSVGVLAYVLLSGYSPFAGNTKQETYLNIAQCQLSFPKNMFRGVTQQAIDFIKETLVVDPKGRLTVEECLEHPWLKDVTDVPRAIVGAGFDTTEVASDEDTQDTVNGHGESNRHDRNGYDCNGHSDHNGHGDHHGHGDHNGHNGMNGYGVNGHGNGVNGVTECNGTNGDSLEEDKESTVAWSSSPTCCELREECEERDNPLKHAHARDVSPPFPDAPSTPKVSRKSHPHPPSVLALCKKFQPDYEKPAVASAARPRRTLLATLNALLYTNVHHYRR
ncbi:serine/threonine-protein kinase 17A isoform X2 [Hyposmocoma kahamanoa]|uniref:serine/threonine-protein kinase 17A isoform X2 n=1 Tax=Hyposmocoma kahamanoa TaxID=1477025 RepID=UPI000E6D82C3|nr:serine/threonine-protein kinase 17A isoform X2 [Hyposmocoma kahamanoa]